MRIFVDTTEPGFVRQAIEERARPQFEVHTSVLHKRQGVQLEGLRRHPFYGSGVDYIIADDLGFAHCAIERKTLEDLVRSLTHTEADGQVRVFRQLSQLASHPTPVLIIQGLHPKRAYARFEPAVTGLQFWCARQGIGVIWTSSLKATAQTLVNIARKVHKGAGEAGAAEPVSAGEA